MTASGILFFAALLANDTGLKELAPASRINNDSYRRATAARPTVEEAMVYEPRLDWTYAHHPHLAFFRGRYFAMWSNGHRSEDMPGQRVLVSSSGDFLHWSKPVPLVDSQRGAKGKGLILTAAGFLVRKDALVGYVGQYDGNRKHTRLFALTSPDGDSWSTPQDLHLPINPNRGPNAIARGRLLISGAFAFPYSDDSSGVGTWHWSGIEHPTQHPTEDNPGNTVQVSSKLGFRAALCEGSFFQTDDGVIHMMLRGTGKGWSGFLYETRSADDGQTWSRPARTHFSDNDAKFQFGRLPDGRYFYVGNPEPKPRGIRLPLVLSLSSNGVDFTQHFVLGERHFAQKRLGHSKGGEYGYPSAIVQDGYLCVIVSRQKEAIQVLRVPLTELHP